MAIGYDEWRKRLGLPHTPQNALRWKQTHGVALGKWNPDGTPVTAAPQSVVPPEQPTPDPYLTPEGFGAASDPDAQSAIADLLADFNTQTGGTFNADGRFVPGATEGLIGTQYGQLIKGLEARRPLIEQGRSDRIESITQDMAGRGLTRSGLRQKENVRATSDAAQQLGDVERQIQDAGTNKGIDLSQAAARYLSGRQNIENRANTAYIGTRLGDFRNAYGGAPVPGKTPEVVPTPMPMFGSPDRPPPGLAKRPVVTTPGRVVPGGPDLPPAGRPKPRRRKWGLKA